MFRTKRLVCVKRTARGPEAIFLGTATRETRRRKGDEKKNMFE
jgi:hypothetical protein